MVLITVAEVIEIGTLLGATTLAAPEVVREMVLHPCGHIALAKRPAGSLQARHTPGWWL